jgi:hypothetical protein
VLEIEAEAPRTATGSPEGRDNLPFPHPGRNSPVSIWILRCGLSDRDCDALKQGSHYLNKSVAPLQPGTQGWRYCADTASNSSSQRVFPLAFPVPARWPGTRELAQRYSLRLVCGPAVNLSLRTKYAPKGSNAGSNGFSSAKSTNETALGLLRLFCALTPPMS